MEEQTHLLVVTVDLEEVDLEGLEVLELLDRVIAVEMQAAETNTKVLVVVVKMELEDL